MRVVGQPSSYALSVVRVLARQFRIVDDDDVLGALRAVGVTSSDRAEALQEAATRGLITRQRGRPSRYRSEVYAGF